MRSSLPSLPQDSARADRAGSTMRWIWGAFCLFVLLAVAQFVVPAYVIQPFRRQTPTALNLAMAIRQRAPVGTALACFLCLLCAFLLWRSASWWRKILIVLPLLLALLATVMVRVNYFEWMFHPIDGAQFLAQSDSKLASGEMVMAVRFTADARAYPISQMAYHHVLNDMVGGIPVAVTY